VLYVADIWCNPKGTTRVMKQLTTIQRAGTLAITSSLCTLPTDILDAHAHLLPALLITDKWCHRALVRMAMLLAEHPLHKVVTNKTTRKAKRHKLPLNEVSAIYDYNFKHFKKIPTTTSNPLKTGKVPCTIHIAENREESTKEAENVSKQIQVYTNGSAINGKVGVAPILMRTGKCSHTLHLHLGPEKEHT
jgi:hypothetical protein